MNENDFADVGLALIVIFSIMFFILFWVWVICV
jgi:predicted permease